MKTLRGIWLVVVAVTFGILVPPPATAQKTTLPAEMLKPSADMSVSKRQLRMGAELGRRVLQRFEEAASGAGSPVDEKAIQAARNTYALIRAAREGMEHSKIYMKYPDPAFELAYKRVLDAWNLARSPIEMVDRPYYLATSIRDLGRALQLVDQALILLP